MEPIYILDSNSLLNFISKLGTLEDPDLHNSDSRQLPSKPSLVSFKPSDPVLSVLLPASLCSVSVFLNPF